MAANCPDGFAGILNKAAQGIIIIWIDNIDKIMRNAAPFGGRRLCSADIHIPVYLHGVDADYLAGKPFRDQQGEFGFAHRSRAAQNKEFLFKAVHRDAYKNLVKGYPLNEPGIFPRTDSGNMQEFLF